MEVEHRYLVKFESQEQAEEFARILKGRLGATEKDMGLVAATLSQWAISISPATAERLYRNFPEEPIMEEMWRAIELLIED